MSEGSNVGAKCEVFSGWLASRYAKLVTRYVWLASRTRFVPLLHQGLTDNALRVFQFIARFFQLFIKISRQHIN